MKQIKKNFGFGCMRPKTDPGLVGTLGFQYNRKYLCAFGLFVKDILRTGHGERNVFAGR